MGDSKGAEWGQYFKNKRPKDRLRAKYDELESQEYPLKKRRREIKNLLKNAPALQIQELSNELEDIEKQLGKLWEKRLNVSDQLTEPPIPAIYLFYGYDEQYNFFGKQGIILKVGKTQRSPKERLSELKKRGLKLYTYWPVDPDSLSKCESEAIKALTSRYGLPIEGDELFLVDSLEEVKEIIDIIVKKHIKRKDKTL